MTQTILKKRLIQETILQPHTIIKPRAAIMELTYNTALTQFNINDYIKQSKKSRRSEKLEDKEKPILQYTMVGQCLSFRKRGFNTTFLLRNVIDLISYEMAFSIYSPILTKFWIRPNHNKKKRKTKGTQYYLRNHAPSKSAIPFMYVFDNYMEL